MSTEQSKTGMGIIAAEHRQQNNKLVSRLHAFDRRYLRSYQASKANQAVQAAQLDAAKECERQADARRSINGGKLFVYRQSKLPGGVRGSVEQPLSFRERPTGFTVVKWSSQRPEYPATELQKERGRWESAPLHVHNEWVVLQLGEPDWPLTGSVSTINLTLPGNESAPRHIRVSCSSESADGPWREVFRFEVANKEDFKTDIFHDYYKISNAFRDFLEKHYGSVEDAWHLQLDVNGDGHLSFIQFTAACSKMQHLPAVKKLKVNPFDDFRKLFDYFDVQSRGYLGLDDLIQHDTKIPVGTWWRLLFVNNWGATASMSLCSPIRLYVVQIGTCMGLYKDNLAQTTARIVREEEDLSQAFNVKKLGVSREQISLRELSQKHEMPLSTLEDIYHRFMQVDKDHSGKIDKDEFQRLILRLHGAKDSKDIPAARLMFFWKNADRDSSGLIDFQEFLQWFHMYFFANENLDASGHVASDRIIENFYRSIVFKRPIVVNSPNYSTRHGATEQL
jgi:Ca2+-binding EF-hand superfamily protein